MANIDEITETPETKKLTPQEEEDIIVNDIAKLKLTYNSSLNELSDAQTVSDETETALYKFVMKMYKKTAEKDPAYDDLFADYVENKQVMLQKQTVSFKALQKYADMQTGYLVRIIKNLQNINQELTKKAAGAQSSVVATPAPEPVPEPPVASSSRGRI